MKAKRKNPQAMTYEQVESRKDRGVEGLRRLGESDRADNLDDESVEDFAERKKITIVNPRGNTHRGGAETRRKPKARTGKNPRSMQSRRRNGEVEAAQQMFKKFHGRKSTTIKEIQQRQMDRSTMAGLGVLMFLRTDLTQEWNGKGVGLTFSEDDKVIVASDPAGNQIYFLGGNQDVTGILPKGVAQKDFIDLGECDVIIYTADKDFDNFEEKDYQHEFGEETGERPRLMFDRLNQQLYLIGGAYEVKREGIVN
jgi:hypothetical protein